MKKLFTYNIIAIDGFLISALSIFFIPWASFNSDIGSPKLAVTMALLFWIGLVIGIIFEVIASKEVKKSRIKIDGKIGLISFFKNKEAIAADALFIIGILLTIIFYTNSLVSTLGLFAIILGLYMHCVLNGKNYRIAKLSINKTEGKENEH